MNLNLQVDLVLRLELRPSSSASRRCLRKMIYAQALLIASFALGGVLASLYPTSPVAETIYGAGRQNLVEWIDDNPKPHLYEISVLKIDLYHDNDVCLSGLSWLWHRLTCYTGFCWHVGDWR